MTLDEKASMARKAGVIEHLGRIQAGLVQFKVSGFHLESDLPLDNVMGGLRNLDTLIDQFVEELGRPKEPVVDVETSTPGWN